MTLNLTVAPEPETKGADYLVMCIMNDGGWYRSIRQLHILAQGTSRFNTGLYRYGTLTTIVKSAADVLRRHFDDEFSFTDLHDAVRLLDSEVTQMALEDA